LSRGELEDAGGFAASRADQKVLPVKRERRTRRIVNNGSDLPIRPVRQILDLGRLQINHPTR
jgi:hypothetical protein